MRKTAIRAVLLLSLAAPGSPAAESGGGHDNLMFYRVVNFLLLAGGLGFLIKKKAGTFLAARGEAIRSGMREAQKLREDAAQRARAIDEKLLSLGEEIERLRAEAKVEISAAGARVERETEAAIRKVFVQAEREMAAAAKAARQELKGYAVSLAVGLAEQRIAARLSPRIQQELVAEFVRGLGGGAA